MRGTFDITRIYETRMYYGVTDFGMLRFKNRKLSLGCILPVN